MLTVTTGLITGLSMRMKGALFPSRCGTIIFKGYVMTCGIIVPLKKPRKCLLLSFTVL